MSSILVVGARSSVAKVAIARLEAEHTVITAGRGECDILIDLNGSVTIPKNIDVVVNFAAAFDGESDHDIINTAHANVVGALKLCAAARKSGAKHFVQISSMSATHSKDSPYYSVYAITKRQADELLDWYCSQYDMTLTVLRPSQLYGNDASFANHQPFIYQVVSAAEMGQDITIYGTHDAHRNYLHAQDFCEIVAGVIDQKISGTFPCLFPQDVTYSQIAKTAQKVFAAGGKVLFLDDKPDTPDNVFDLDLRIYERTGYKPIITIEAGIKGIKNQREVLSL